MKVKATQKGYFGKLRQAGDVFEYDGPTTKEVDGKKVNYFPSWMEPVKSAGKEVPKESKAGKSED